MSEDPLIGAVLGERYRVDELVGTGAMGRVYRAEHILMRKRVALKVLHQELMAVSEITQRFEREARAAAHIEHPHVAAATDFGKLDDGSFFLVLEFIEGRSLSDVIEEGPTELSRVLNISWQIACALEAAHAHGIVHRDLKPDNLLLVDQEGDDDFVKILDFGIAKVPTETSEGERITQVGLVYGTPEYMAPEQALGQEVDARADLYALGVVMYELLTGRRPYVGPAVSLLGQQLSEPLPRMSRVAKVQVPPAVEGFVSKLLAMSPDKRPKDAAIVRERLELFRVALAEGKLVGPANARASLLSINLEEVTSRLEPLTARLPGPLLTFFNRLFAKSRFGGGLILVFVFGFLGVLLAVTAARRVTPHEVAESPQVIPQPAERASQPVARGMDWKLETALAEAREGGVASLRRLTEEYPAEGIVFAELALALSKDKRFLEATEAVRDALGLDPKLNENSKIAEALFRAAQSPKARGATFRLLQGAMGPAGVGIIYDLAESKKLARGVRNEAARLLRTPELRASASPAMLLVLDLKGARACREVKALLSRAEMVGDKRALPALRALLSTSGCGAKKGTDCYPCLRGDEALGAAIQTIEQRSTLAASESE